jgi:hypothetical protein
MLHQLSSGLHQPLLQTRLAAAAGGLEMRPMKRIESVDLWTIKDEQPVGAESHIRGTAYGCELHDNRRRRIRSV